MSKTILEFTQHLFNNPGIHKITKLATEFGVTRKTIYDWCDRAQAQYGIWIETSTSNPDIKRGHAKVSDKVPEHFTVVLTRVELDALLAAADRLEPLTSLPKHAIKKLSEAKRFTEKPSYEPILYTPLADQYADIFSNISECIRNRQVARVSYKNAQGQEKSYKFNAYVIIPSDQHLHLIGVSHNSLEAGFDTAIRLRLDQIQSFEPCHREYFKKPNFKVAEYATKEFGPFSSPGKTVSIRVKFSSEKAHYIQRTRRHKTQKTGTDKKDGSVVWTIQAPISDDLVYWIVSYGPHARVLAPKELRTRVLEWARGSVKANG